MNERTRFILAATGVLCASVLAGANPPKIDAFEHARSVPADVHFFLAIDDAATLRTSAAGRAAEEWVREFLRDGKTRAAWEMLAQRVELKSADAFDALLGRGMVFAARFEAEGADEASGNWSWIVLSEVTDEIAQKLRAGLQATPRWLEKGVPVLSLEEGRFSLVVMRRASASLLLLAPTDAMGLFDQMAPALRDGLAEPLSASAEFARVRALGAAPQIVVFARNRETMEQWSAGILVARDAGFDAAFVLHRPRADAHPIPAPTWDAGMIEAVPPEMLGFVVEACSSGAAVCSGAASLLLGLQVVEELHGSQELGGLSAIALLRSPAVGEPGIDFVAAVEVNDVANAARLGDAAVGRWAAGLLHAAKAGVMPDPGTLDWQGLEPGAGRFLKLPPPPGWPASILWADGLDVAWSYRTVVEAGEPGESNRSRGWWTLGTSEQAVEAVSAVLVRPSREETPKTAALLSVGFVRPAAIFERLAGAGDEADGRSAPQGTERLDPISLLGLFARCREISWRVGADPQGLLVGTGRIEFVAEGEPGAGLRAR